MQIFANIVASVLLVVLGVLAFYSLEDDILPGRPRAAIVTAIVMTLVVFLVIWW